jgi:diacylglycerol kinase family enzyme
MKIAIIINAQRLTPELKEQLALPSLKTHNQLDFDVFVAEPKAIEQVFKDLNEQAYDAILVGGGDGTVMTAAQALAGKETPLAILALGTFNVLAKHLGYPDELSELLKIIKNNKTKKIDYVSLNDKIFLNHCWIGFYTKIMQQREKHKLILKRSRFLKLLFNGLIFFKNTPIYQIEMNVNNETLLFKTPLVFIGNNAHDTTIFDFGDRKSLSTGLLSVNVLNCKSRWDLIKAMAAIMTNRFQQSHYLTQFSTDQLTINVTNKMINVVIDGELVKLDTPLEFVVHQKQLTMITP